jgi:hypothetical protein
MIIVKGDYEEKGDTKRLLDVIKTSVLKKVMNIHHHKKNVVCIQ